jgi:hypothetical protein
MITADLTGNLGNHMFQYALTRVVAEYNGYEWGFNRITSNDYYNGKPQMDFMDIDYGKEHNTLYGQLPKGIDKTWTEPREIRDGNSFYPYAPGIFGVEDNTKLIIPCGQDARYFENRKEDIRKWFEIKIVSQFDILLRGVYLSLDDNTCVINVRGGEYKGINSLILDGNYWNTAINKMVEWKHDIKFIVITDDIPYAKSIFPYPVFHYSIGMDYYVIYHAKNLILSNSSFAIFPTWLNPHNPYVIVPKYWAGHNAGKQWLSSDIWTFGWNFLDKYGVLSNGKF